MQWMHILLILFYTLCDGVAILQSCRSFTRCSKSSVQCWEMSPARYHPQQLILISFNAVPAWEVLLLQIQDLNWRNLGPIYRVLGYLGHQEHPGSSDLSGSSDPSRSSQIWGVFRGIRVIRKTLDKIYPGLPGSSDDLEDPDKFYPRSQGSSNLSNLSGSSGVIMCKNLTSTPHSNTSIYRYRPRSSHIYHWQLQINSY